MPFKREDDRFFTLVAHFFNRFFDTDVPSEESVPRARLIQFLAIVGVVTPLLMVLLVRGQQSVQMQLGAFDFAWFQTGIRFTLVCLAMVVTGLVMTYKWDSLFPDRRDYLILIPLPISGRRLFAAKAAALAIFIGFFIVATNLVLTIASAFIAPGAIAGHIAGVWGGSIFAALYFATLQGVLINVTTPSAFRRISPSIQMVSIALLITVLLVIPLIVVGLRPLAVANSSLLDYFPPVWFLGLYEVLQPSASVLSKASHWAWTGIGMTGIFGVAVALSYVVGYRRHARKILEGPEANDLTPGWWENLRIGALHSCLLPNAFQRAAFDFIEKISRRNPKHQISTALYSGMGLALALSSLFVIDRGEAFPLQLSSSGVLQAPAVLSFLAVAGWRATFSIPYELPANWLFQMTSGSAAEFRKAIRKWLFVCRILPLYALIAVFEFAWFDYRTATTHLGFDLVTTAFLTEAFFFGFRKVPFTCDYVRSKLQLGFYAVGYLFAFTTYSSLMGDLKQWVSRDPEHLQRFLGVSLIALGIILVYRSITGAERSRFIYDDQESAFQELKLS
jgi:hypothetical protein